LVVCRWPATAATANDQGATTDLRVYATRNYSIAVHHVQGQELLHDQEPENDPGPSGDEQVLPEVPQAHAAQGIEVIAELQNCGIAEFRSRTYRFSDSAMNVGA
jgi:hypothetical protein